MGLKMEILTIQPPDPPLAGRLISHGVAHIRCWPSPSIVPHCACGASST